MHGRFSTEWSLHKHSLVLLVFMWNMNLSDYISEKWVLSLRKNSNECTRTSWVAHSIFTHSWWQDLCKQEKKIPSIVSSFYTYSIQTNCVFLSLMKSPSFLPLSMCVCVSLSYTHSHETHPQSFSPFLINDHLIQLWKSGQRGGWEEAWFSVWGSLSESASAGGPQVGLSMGWAQQFPE